MYNTKESLPDGVFSPWEAAKKKIAEIKAEERMALKAKKKDLTLDIFNRPALEWERLTWEETMDLPFELCRDIVRNSRYMQMEDVKKMVLSHYDMNESEEELFRILYEFGRSLGVSILMGVVYDQAIEGCLKSQTLILDKMHVSGVKDGAGDGEDSGDAIINVMLSNGSDDSGDDSENDVTIDGVVERLELPNKNLDDIV